MHFERRNAFQNAYNYITLFPEKKCPILPKILDPITQNTLIFLFGLTNSLLVSEKTDIMYTIILSHQRKSVLTVKSIITFTRLNS